MSNNYLEEIFPFLNTIEEDRQNQFREYFKSVPVWLLSSLCVEKIEKGKTFIREGESVELIYFVCDGIIKATDYRVFGIAFDFMLFTKVYAFGGMEVIMECEEYQTSLHVEKNGKIIVSEEQYKLIKESLAKNLTVHTVM